MRLLQQLNWKLFHILFAAALVSSVLVLPYALNMVVDNLAELPLPLPLLLAISVAQAAILFGVAIIVGLILAPRVSLGVPLLETLVEGRRPPIELRSYLTISVGAGVLAGVLIIAGDYMFFLLGSPLTLFTADLPAWWRGLLAAFYGGIAEEVLMRLFLMTLLVWIFSKIVKTGANQPPAMLMWTSIVIAAAIFGILHLPATAAITPLTDLVVVRALVLNALGGIIFGLLYWKKGLESAMIAHFTADIVLHVILQLLI